LSACLTSTRPVFIQTTVASNSKTKKETTLDDVLFRFLKSQMAFFSCIISLITFKFTSYIKTANQQGCVLFVINSRYCWEVILHLGVVVTSEGPFYCPKSNYFYYVFSSHTNPDTINCFSEYFIGPKSYGLFPSNRILLPNRIEKLCKLYFPFGDLQYQPFKHIVSPLQLIYLVSFNPVVFFKFISFI
jgi:hypothetical protein